MMTGDGRKPPGTTEIKLITDQHFVCINYDAMGKTLAEGGGRYTFNGSEAVEHLDYADKDKKISSWWQGPGFGNYLRQRYVYVSRHLE